MCTLIQYLRFMGAFFLSFCFVVFALRISHLYCLNGCLSMTAWLHAVLGVLYAYV